MRGRMLLLFYRFKTDWYVNKIYILSLVLFHQSIKAFFINPLGVWYANCFWTRMYCSRGRSRGNPLRIWNQEPGQAFVRYRTDRV